MMKRFFVFAIFSLLAACAQKEISPEVHDIAAPAAPDLKVDNLILRSARANMKANNGNKKVAGIIHFAQTDANLKTEVQLEGLQAGPYDLRISDKTSCKKAQKNKQKSLGQVIADKNGVVKTTVEITNLSANGIVGKTFLLHAKSKRSGPAAACGVIEKI